MTAAKTDCGYRPRLPLELLLDELRDDVPRDEEPLLLPEERTDGLLALEVGRLTELRLGVLRLGALTLGVERRLLPLDGRLSRSAPSLPDERTVLEVEDRVDGRVTVVLRDWVLRLGVYDRVAPEL